MVFDRRCRDKDQAKDDGRVLAARRGSWASATLRHHNRKVGIRETVCPSRETTLNTALCDEFLALPHAGRTVLTLRTLSSHPVTLPSMSVALEAASRKLRPAWP